MRKRYRFFSVAMAFILVMGCNLCALSATLIDNVTISVADVHEGMTVGEFIDSVSVSATGATYEQDVSSVNINGASLGRDVALEINKDYKLTICLTRNSGYEFKEDTYYNYTGNTNVTFNGASVSNVVGLGAGPGDMEFSISFSLNSKQDIPENNKSFHIHEWDEGEIYSATTATDGLGGIYCKTCGAIKESWPISAYGYSINDYATPMVNASKAGQTVTFELGEWNSFPKAFMEKIAAKSAEGVTFVFHYKWNHVKQEITISAGAQVDLNYEWYGPAKMAELYGAN